MIPFICGIKKIYPLIKVQRRKDKGKKYLISFQIIIGEHAP